MEEYIAWVVFRGESRWYPLGRFDNQDQAWNHAHNRYGLRLVSVKKVTKPAPLRRAGG